uniref:RRM domain-containing protein n=1 Tax=Ditylenchus dipsaci TaxID=166011 RepID=A0A915E591_9BILA
MEKQKTDRRYGRIFKLSKFQNNKVMKLKDAKVHTWNPLFLGSNATADALSAKIGVEKYDLLAGNGASSSAVRMAMAETKLVKETRDFLVDSNVKLGKCASESGEKERRSDITIIVKNLPSGIEPEELRSAFARFGGVKYVKISPGSGLCAIVEMQNRMDAKRVFNRLAYSTLPGRDQPLYLEWAPLQVNHAATFQVESTSREPDDQGTRLPKKVGAASSSSHRGFCFVDYVAAGDAKRAYDALYLSTHLYGRRLVLEWAKLEDTVEELRTKSANKLRSSRKEFRGHKKSIQTAIKRKHSTDDSDDGD